MPPPAANAPVLVTDFDGTMSQHDFFKLAIEELIPGPPRNYWSLYERSEITHFEALRRYFAEIRGDESVVRRALKKMEFDPRGGDAIAALRDAGWEVVVASAGCRWYIDILLEDAGIDIRVYANPGRFEAGQGLLMELPPPNFYRSETHGVDKSAVVRRYLDEGRRVAYAGDGVPDLEPAKLVKEEWRFARSDLADLLRDAGLGYYPFEHWSEVADRLLKMN